MNYDSLIKDKGGIRLDIGCGGNKQAGFVGMDARPLDGVDIVHDLEVFPWPLPDECCLTIVGSHIIEHIKPWLTIPLFNELWRIMMVGGQLALATPYAGSPGFWQDPTHCNGFNEATFQYFDPEYPLYGIYKPKPWKLASGFPVWQVTGQLEVLMDKMPVEPEPPPLGVRITESVGSSEVVE
jgi:hypothetical protein